MWGFKRLETLWRDLRFGLRMLLNRPGFTSIAIVTLALGVGVTSAVFSLIQGVLLTPPPYQRPEQIMLISPARAGARRGLGPQGWAAAQWMEWRNEAQSFEAVAAYDWTFNFLISADGSESLEGMWVTQDYFRVVGLRPVLGRTFLDSETAPGGPPVVILGHELWQRKFGGDPDIIGKAVRIGRQETPPTVIGVMPPNVRFLPSPSEAQEPNYDINARVDFWGPAVPNPTRLKQPMWNVVGRLRDGVTRDEAQAELANIAARQAQADRDFEGLTAHVRSLTAELNGDGRRILLPLLGASALVLLIACGNAAALLLVRGLQRQQEYAVRCALGAGRAALFRQVSLESLLLALSGGALGAGLAFGIVKVFKLIGGHAIPRLDAVTTGWPVLAFGLGAALLSAVLAGLFPALRASRLDPAHALKSAGPKSSAGRGERRLLRAVTMIQMALTLALLAGAGLLIRTMSNLAAVRSGYDTERVLTMSVTAVQGDLLDFHRRALGRVSALPGVSHAAFAWGVPLTGNSWSAEVEIEGRPVAGKTSDKLSLPLRAVTEDYFTTLGLAISEGRGFRPTDTDKAPGVAIVNRSFADRYFPQADPLGKKLWLFGPQQPASQIIGVVGDGRTDDLTRAAEPEIYLSFWQNSAYSKHLVVRMAADPRALAGAVRGALREIDPTVAVENVKTMEQIRADSLAPRGFAMRLLIGFAAVASVLTLIGIYGVLSLSAASRRRELAVRVAVGAGRRDILRLILGEGLRLIACGVLAGLAVALALSRALRSFLFEVEPGDPATLLGVGLLFACVALMACWVPARRAAKSDPLQALRGE